MAKHLRQTLDGAVYLQEANGKELQRLKYRLLPGGIIRQRGTAIDRLPSCRENIIVPVDHMCCLRNP